MFAASFAACFALTPAAGALARRWGWLDLPSRPLKVHSAAIPRAGGMPIWLVLSAALLAVRAVTGPAGDISASTLGLFLAGTAAFVAGVLDDARGLSPRLRLSIEILGAGAAVGLGYRLGVTGVAPLDAAISVILLVGFANAFNLVDGIDGLAAGLGGAAAVFLGLLGMMAGDGLTVVCGASLAGCCIGFLKHNVSEKKVFLGDGGSLLLGMTLSALAIRLGASRGGTAADAAAPLLVLALPAMDTAFAVIRRLYLRRPVFAGDRAHIYDFMIRRGLTARATVLCFIAAGCLAGAAAVGCWGGPAYALGAGSVAGALAVTTWRVNGPKPTRDHQTGRCE